MQKPKPKEPKEPERFTIRPVLGFIKVEAFKDVEDEEPFVIMFNSVSEAQEFIKAAA